MILKSIINNDMYAEFIDRVCECGHKLWELTLFTYTSHVCAHCGISIHPNDRRKHIRIPQPNQIREQVKLELLTEEYKLTTDEELKTQIMAKILGCRYDK